MYEYNAKLINVVDGDTLDFEVSLGFGIFHKIRVRLDGIDTPEIRRGTEEERKHGREAKKYLEWSWLNQEGVLVTHKDRKGKYGRYIADFYSNGKDIVGDLIDNGFEKREDYEHSTTEIQ